MWRAVARPSGASFCHVIRRKARSQGVPARTEGNQWCAGALPLFTRALRSSRVAAWVGPMSTPARKRSEPVVWARKYFAALSVPL